MSCRRPLYSDSKRSSSRSPTRRIQNQTDIRSPFQVESTPESYVGGDESDSGESLEEVVQANITPIDSEAEASLEQSGFSLESTGSPVPKTPPNWRQEPKREAKPPPSLVKPKSGILKLIGYALIFILPLVAYSCLPPKKPQEKRCAFEELRQRQPLQSPDVWRALTINIELLLNRKIKSPNVFLFVHSKQSNEQTIKSLIQDIAQETSKCFDGQRPIEMSLNDFETKDGDDYGYPIEQYKKKLREGNVFLIVNLNDISPNAARALHTICDTHNPIAPDVVIFLTLRTHLTADVGGPAQVAYRTLQELWQQVPDNELDALITRVVDQVLLLQD